MSLQDFYRVSTATMKAGSPYRRGGLPATIDSIKEES